MILGNLFSSSTSTAPAEKVGLVSTSSESITSRVQNSLLPPIPSMDLSLLSSTTSTTYTSASDGLSETDTSYVSSEDRSAKLGGGLPSYQSIYTEPPLVKQPYDPTNALLDLPALSYALDLFLQSHMLESEEFCHKSDEQKERLYFSTGYGLIQCVKGLMSYEDDVSNITLLSQGFIVYLLPHK